MVAKLWEKPDAYETSIAMHASEGYPDFASASHVYWYDTAYALREANRLKGIDVSDEDKAAVLESANVYRRWLFHSLLIRWLRLLAITQGPRSTAYIAYEYFASDGVANFVDLERWDASGSGTTVYISWTDADGMPANSYYAESSVQPGMFVADHGTGLWGMTQIVDIQYQGESGGTHTAVLTLLSPLNANRESALWIYRENYPRTMPVFHLLRSDRAICSRSVEVEHSAFSSFKTAYGADGIDGQHYCTHLAWPGALIETYTAACKQTTCPYYLRAKPGEPDKDFFTDFFLNPGDRVRQLTFAAIDSPAIYAAERIGYEGLFTMLGIPTYRHTDGLYLLTSALMASGLVYYVGATYGEETPRYMGFKIYADFEAHEAYRTALGYEEKDDLGIFGQIGLTNVQSDQTGGSLILDEARTPGMDLERRLTRSIGYTLTDPGDAISAGEHYVYGYGFSGAQRPYARKYTSRAINGPLTVGGSGTVTDEETRVSILAEAVTVGWIDAADPLTAKTFDYRVKWEIPRLGDSVTDPLEEKTKTVGAHAVKKGTLNAAGNLLTLEFALGYWTGLRAGQPQTYPDELPYRAGANVVCPPLSWESRNPGSYAPLGGRQARVFPGDAIQFSGDESLVGVRGTVVAAEAYGGALDDDASMPGGIPHLPAALLARYGYRDTVTIALEGVSGRALQAAQQAGLFDTGDIAISKVGLLSVAPPNVDYNGAARGYAATVSTVLNDVTKTALTEGTDYVFDRATGSLYFAEAVFTTTGQYKLHYAGYALCSQPMLPHEEAQTLNEIIDTVEEEAYLPLRMRYGSQAIALSMVRDSDSYTYDHAYWDLTPDLTPYNDSWTLNTGLARMVKGGDTGNSFSFEWRKTTLYEGARAVLGSKFTNFSGSINALAMNYYNQAYAIEFYPAWNLRAADIGSAHINLDFSGATVYKSSFAWDHSTGVFPTVATLVESDELELRLLCCIVEFDSVDTDLITSITPVTVDVATNLTRLDVPIDPYDPGAGTESRLRGTLEITEILKYICANQHTLSLNQMFYVFVNGSNDMISSNADPRFLVRSWLTDWNGELTAAGGDEVGCTRGALSTSWIEYDSLTVSSPILHLASGALAAGPIPHFDADGLALAPVLTAAGG